MPCRDCRGKLANGTPEATQFAAVAGTYAAELPALPRRDSAPQPLRALESGDYGSPSRALRKSERRRLDQGSEKTIYGPCFSSSVPFEWPAIGDGAEVGIREHWLHILTVLQHEGAMRSTQIERSLVKHPVAIRRLALKPTFDRPIGRQSNKTYVPCENDKNSTNTDTSQKTVTPVTL